MNHISIQSDTDMSNPFTEGFVKVGKEMEAVAEELGLKISGRLTPYGLHCVIEGETPFFKNLKVKVWRKLENVATDSIPLMSHYSTIIELNSEVSIAGMNTKIRIGRKGILGRFKARLLGLKACQQNGMLVLYSNDPSLGDAITSADLVSLDKLHWLKFQCNRIELRSLSIPEDKSKMVAWLSSIEQLIRIATTKAV